MVNINKHKEYLIYLKTLKQTWAIRLAQVAGLNSTAGLMALNRLRKIEQRIKDAEIELIYITGGH